MVVPVVYEPSIFLFFCKSHSIVLRYVSMLHVQIDAMLWNRALVSYVTDLILAGSPADITSGGSVIGIGVWCVGVTNTTYGRAKVTIITCYHLLTLH